MEQLAVEQFPTEGLSQPSSNLASACSEFTRYRDGVHGENPLVSPLEERPSILSLRFDDFDENASILDEIVADRTGPQNANDKLPADRILCDGDADPDLLSEEPARAYQAEAGGRQIACQQRILVAVFGLDLDRLHEIDAVLFAPLDEVAAAVATDKLADRFDDAVLLLLFVADAVADGDGVIITTFAIGQRRAGHGQHILPHRFTKTGLVQRRADLTRQNVAVSLCLADDSFRHALKIHRNHGVRPLADGASSPASLKETQQTITVRSVRSC